MRNCSEFKGFGILKGFLQNPKVKVGLEVAAIGGGLVLLVKCYLKYQKKKRRDNYPKDVVILHQLPRGLHCPRYEKRIFVYYGK